MIKRIMYSLAMLLIGIAGAQAQVVINDGTISLTTLTDGAVLDLQSANKGLLLPHIGLPDFGAWQITDNIADAVDGTLAHDTISGLDVVYHETPNNPIDQCHWFPEGLSDNDCRYLLSQSCVIYVTGKFGEAGCWMTENLAETAYAYTSGNPALTRGTGTSNTQRLWNFPKAADPTGSGEVTNLAWARNTNAYQPGLGKPGLLYSFNAANDLVDNTELTNRYVYNRTDTTLRQGICPTGWHLPSDSEWSALEKEIALNPAAYASGLPSPYPAADYTVDLPFYDYFGNTSNNRPISASTGYGAANSHTGSWGYQMKGQYKPTATNATSNTADVDGVSKLATAGGFSGLKLGNTGNGWNNYGSDAFFLSSSSFSGTRSWYRGLDDRYSGMNRVSSDKFTMMSVRCKKN